VGSVRSVVLTLRSVGSALDYLTWKCGKCKKCSSDTSKCRECYQCIFDTSKCGKCKFGSQSVSGIGLTL